MPNPHELVGRGAIRPDKRDSDKVPLTLSSEMRARGKTALRNKDGIVPYTDQQISGATIVGAAIFPSTFALPMPPVMYQGGLGSCATCSTVHYMLSYEWYKKSGASSYDNAVNVFSAGWVFDQVHTGLYCDGSSVITNLNFLKNNGCILEGTFPYNESSCVTTVTDEQRALALPYKIGNYATVPITDRSAVKTLLMQGHPISIMMVDDFNFYYGKDKLLDPTHVVAVNNNYIHKSLSDETYALHEVTICEWDDTKNAYKIVNSWDTTWGDAGYRWVDFDFIESGIQFTTQCYYISGWPVSNTAPVANAGFDQNAPAGSIVSLDGTGSYDPDGYISVRAWTQVSGPNSATITNSDQAVCQLSNLIAGTYVLKLTITDNSSATAFDTVNVVVTAASIESAVLSVTTQTVKGKKNHILSWVIALNTAPQSAVIESIISPSTTYGTVFTISPYTPQGTWTNYSTIKRKIYYYRLNIITSTGATMYSNVVTLTN